MSPAELLQALGTIGDSEEGVDRLRQLILQLAVRGQLVEQSPMDRQVRPDIDRAEKLEDQNRWSARLCDDAPAAWPRCPMVCLGRWGSGGTPRKGNGDYYDGEIPWLMISDLNNATVIDSEIKITKAGLENSSAKMIPPGTVLVGLYGSIGKCAIAGIECCTNQAIGHCIPDPAIITTDYLFRLVQALGPELFARGQGGAQKNISQTIIKHLEVTIPPLAEQGRIVAKVDELMGLLDELERARDEREARRAAFRDSALAALQNAEDAEAAHAAWNRIATNLADCLTDPADIAPLRQTILQLAVRGRLVQQDARDGSGDDYLEAVAALKAKRGIREAPRTTGQTVPPVCVGLPDSWRVVEFGDTHINRDGDRVPVTSSEREHRQGPYPYYGASGAIDTFDEYLFDGTFLLIGEDGANLVNRATPIAFLAEGRFWVNNHAHVLEGLDRDSLRFLAIFINAIDLKPYLTGIAQPKLNQRRMNAIPTPVPPIAEQRRIVTKVDELMAVCDELEQQLTEAKAHQSAFAAAAVHHLDLTPDLSAPLPDDPDPWPQPTPEQIDRVLAHLPDLRGDRARLAADRLWQDLSPNNMFVPFDWGAWKAGQAVVNMKPGWQASVARADTKAIQRLFTTTIRANAFCEGVWDDAVRGGLITAMLQRLAEIRKSM